MSITTFEGDSFFSNYVESFNNLAIQESKCVSNSVVPTLAFVATENALVKMKIIDRLIIWKLFILTSGIDDVIFQNLEFRSRSPLANQ